MLDEHIVNEVTFEIANIQYYIRQNKSSMFDSNSLQ